jgi:hypothetical protein
MVTNFSGICSYTYFHLNGIRVMTLPVPSEATLLQQFKFKGIMSEATSAVAQDPLGRTSKELNYTAGLQTVFISK